MYTLKKGVVLFMSDEVEKILSVIVTVFHRWCLPVVVTSGIDGPHREGSLHEIFRAIDIRKNFSNGHQARIWENAKENILTELRIETLKRKYPIVIIDETDHIHVEYQR